MKNIVKYIAPFLKEEKNVDIYLDGVEGYSISFLDEAFATLVSRGYINREDFYKRLNFIVEDDLNKKYLSWIEEHVQEKEFNTNPDVFQSMSNMTHL